MRTFGAALLGAGLLATSAEATTIQRAVFSGGKIELWKYSTLKADCTSDGVPSLRITNNPQHGSVTTRGGLIVAYVPANWPLHDCNGRRIQGEMVDYRAEGGFVGSDYVSIDAIYPNGKELMLDFYITVK
jgi:hypothetical protein